MYLLSLYFAEKICNRLRKVQSRTDDPRQYAAILRIADGKQLNHAEGCCLNVCHFEDRGCLQQVCLFGGGVSVIKTSDEKAELRRARAATLAFMIAACLWQWAFYLFVACYALGVGAWLIQRRFIYRPAKRPYRSPSSLRLEGVDEIRMEGADGGQILAWKIEAQPGMPTILYLHGNNCNLSNRLERVSRFSGDGYGLLMPSFRGYGLSDGRPSEVNNVNDALKACEDLRASGIQARDIVVYGESLGTGVAVQVAAKCPVGALVLEAPYTSLRDLVRYKLPFIPAWAFLRDSYDSVRHIRKVAAPLLIVHSLGDDIIPFAFGRRLFRAASDPKAFLRVRGAGHTGLFRAGVWPDIRRFIEQHVENAAGNGGKIRRKRDLLRQKARKAAHTPVRPALRGQRRSGA